MPPIVKKKEKVVEKPEKVKKVKKVKTVKKIGKMKRKVDDDEEEHIWIYGCSSIDNEAYEFHPELQDYIEKCWKRGNKRCQVNIFTTVWTIDFQSMTRTKNASRGRPIKRVPKSLAKAMKSLVGIEGFYYERKDGFQQTENICNICLAEPTIPTRIDLCGHVFCFVCIKTNYNMGLDCPTCRGRIPSHLVEENTVRCDLDLHMECSQEYKEECSRMLKSMETRTDSRRVKPMKGTRRSKRSTKTKYYWVYQAKINGWYRYDPKNEKYIEECFLRKMDECMLFICGHEMTIDLKNLTQERSCYDGEVHRRRIKRIKSTDVIEQGVRGIAGIDTVVYPVPKN